MAWLPWERLSGHMRRGAYLLYVAYPVPDVVERLLIGDVIHQQDALQTGSDVTTGRRVDCQDKR